MGAILKNIYEGKYPLWAIFAAHLLITCIVKVINILITYDSYISAEGRFMLGVISYMVIAPTSLFVIWNAKWSTPRDYDKPYNNAFIHQFAILFVVFQWTIGLFI